MKSHSAIAIDVRNLSKAYAKYRRPSDRLWQLLTFGRGCYYDSFWALNDVSFTIFKGECVGIIGRNGSGKSTLLQIIAGVLRPTHGEAEVHGRVAALLELGAGFNPEFTGRENIWLSGSVLGLSEDEIRTKESAIIEFSGIEAFIDQPVKTYSSGMYARLAFSVASSVDPDILIVDEILSVGDAKFQARCFQRLHDLKQRNVTILLVTHSAEQVVTHCDRALLLEGGRQCAIGTAQQVTNEYYKLLFPATESIIQTIHNDNLQDDAPFDDSAVDVFHHNPHYNPHESRWGDLKAEIIDLSISDSSGHRKTACYTGEKIQLLVKIKSNTHLKSPILGLTVKTKEGITINGSNTELCSTVVPSFIPDKVYVFRIALCLRVGPGDYFLSLGIATRDNTTGDITPHDRRYDSIHLRVDTNRIFYGLCDLEMDFSFEQPKTEKLANVG
jgi:lipopolysaccharide transport system ATP-binding protein